MIKNEAQYQYTQEWARRFEGSMRALEQDEELKQKDPEGWQLSWDVKQVHLDKLRSEIAEYERLTSHDRDRPIVLTLDDIDDLSQILIKARMAAKLSQKELADLSGLTEEQICRYEDNDYEDASFLEVKFVLDALDIRVQKAEFLVPLDTLRRTPVTKEELLGYQRKTDSDRVAIEQ